MTDAIQKLKDLVTIENAIGWKYSAEQYLFCDNLISGADIYSTPDTIEVLEIFFERLLDDKALGRVFMRGDHAPRNEWP